MDSPEITKPVPSPAANNSAAAVSPTVVQDSPFFTYVSNLSPIKPLKDVCAPSAFRELNFPSPSPVFTSPHANPIRKENLLRRCQYVSPDSGKSCLKYSGSTKQFSEETTLLGSNAPLLTVVPVPCTVKDSDSECESPTQPQSCSSPSGCVDEFLADPIEDSVDSCGPSDLDRAAQLPRRSQDRYTTPNEGPTACAQSQNCRPSGNVNETLSNQVASAKANDSAHIFSACDLSQASEIGNNDNKEAISNLNFHNDKLKEGRVKTQGRRIENLPGKTNDSVGGAVEDCTDDDRAHKRLSEPVFHAANDVAKVDKHEEITSDVPAYCNSVDQDADDESSVLPVSGEGDTLDQRGKRVTYPLGHSHYAKHHSPEKEKGMEFNSTPNMQATSVRIIPLDSNQHDMSGASANTSAENVISYERGSFPSKLQSEGCQYQRAMRKRLEFDSGPSNEENFTASHVESACNVQVSQSAHLLGHTLSRPSSHLNRKAQANAEKVARSIQKSGSSLLTTAPRPSGIGLHLNSIVNVVTTNIHINVQSEKYLEKDNLSSSGEMMLHCSTQQRVNDSNVCLASNALTDDISVRSAVDSYSLVTVSGNSDDDQQGNQAVTLPSSSSSLLPRVNTNLLKNSFQSKFLDHCIVPCNMKGPPVEDACGSEEISEMSPRKKRKKTSEDVGCKRCNCKKSKCLKLYCDCFAAGVYCADACACQGCFNRPEFEDTVLETRQQIENRNPLAFAPKVVVRIAETAKSSGEETKGITPRSARHKRGCNCKRSQCLKKYCECFQAKVGCSLGCRCEGCKNSFGKKDVVDMVETEHVRAKDERWKNNLSDDMHVDIRSEMLNNDKHLRRLSPFTPLQEGYNGGNVSESQYASRRYISSPEPSSAVLGKSQKSPTNSGDTNRLMKVREGNAAPCSYRNELEGHDEDEAGLFSPTWERLAERCHLRLLPCSSPGDPRGRTDSLRAPIFQGSGRPPVGSLLWHSSPITPMPLFGENRHSLESCSDSEPLNAHEDDTPDILKDACVPDKGLKMSSPNKKRVSPPHRHMNETKTSSSTSMRSRKFILKSVPSFPSLTPYGNNIMGHGT